MSAYFTKAPGEYAGGWFDQAHGIVTASVGQKIEVGLIEDWTQDGDSSDVRFNDFGNPDCVAKLTGLPMSGGTRLFLIEPRRKGNVMLEARVPPPPNREWFSMPVRTFIQLAVLDAAGGGEDELMHA